MKLLGIEIDLGGGYTMMLQGGGVRLSRGDETVVIGDNGLISEFFSRLNDKVTGALEDPDVLYGMFFDR